jgi:hypothetical protein
MCQFSVQQYEPTKPILAKFVNSGYGIPASSFIKNVVIAGSTAVSIPLHVTKIEESVFVFMNSIIELIDTKELLLWVRYT